MSGSGISWAICKSASRSRLITMPAPHHSSFLQAECPSCRPTNSIKTLKARIYIKLNRLVFFYLLDSPLMQPLSRSSLVFLFVLDPQLHTPYISSPNHHLFAAHAHTNAACSTAIPMHAFIMTSFIMSSVEHKARIWGGQYESTWHNRCWKVCLAKSCWTEFVGIMVQSGSGRVQIVLTGPVHIRLLHTSYTTVLYVQVI